MRLSAVLLFVLIGAAHSQWDTNFQPGRAGIVHLFEWHWDTIADECENLLGPAGFGGVQISPPSENRVVDGRPWWERYQPISYILNTRSGDRAALSNMIKRCEAAGVGIYADIVVNHMCGVGGSGTGTSGSYYDANSYDFPAVPYSGLDFNDGNCYTSSGSIENFGDADQVRNCKLVGLIDLNQGKDYVRSKIVEFMNDLIDIGVKGFRVDACKHMWPGDLEAMFGSLKDLPSGGRAMIFQEVIDQGGEPITASQYFGAGRVTAFKYGINIGNNKNSIHYLENFGESWGMMPDGSALVFLNNHDNQRGHGGGGSLITFEDSYNLKIMNAFMMAWPYGVKRVMSSYYFDNSDQGPPGQQRSINADGSCGNGWVCEHRWTQIKNMAAFAGAAQGQQVANWWTNSNNQIAFSRGNKAFLAINKAGYDMNENLQTGLPGGSYCNVISGDVTSDGCTGTCINVDGSGFANIYIKDDSNPVVALHVNAKCSGNSGGSTGGNSGGSSGGSSGSTGGQCSSCSDCGSKTDCGFLGIDQSGCEASGCMWCPSSVSGEPWCIHKSGSSTDGSTSSGGSSSSCSVSDSSKTDCGYLGIGQSECETTGCCWAESSQSGVPWCFNKA